MAKCKFCDVDNESTIRQYKKIKVFDETMDVATYLDVNNELLLEIGECYCSGLKVNYCPMCGRKL